MEQKKEGGICPLSTEGFSEDALNGTKTMLF
jgi:hypothetical protein